MPFSNVIEAETILQRKSQLNLESYDSGNECSFAHLVELYKLVEAEEHDLDGYVFDESCLGVA